MQTNVAIIGAGAIGLELAHAIKAKYGFGVTIFEAGKQIASNIRSWGHVRMFSPWRLNRSDLGVAIQTECGIVVEENHVPTGQEYIEQYLEPLARHPRVQDCVRLDARVVSVSRRGTRKGELIGSRERARNPFRLVITNGAGEQTFYANTVFDTSGAFTPTTAGDGGVPAVGESAAHSHIIYQIPQREQLESLRGHVVVSGAGYSAATTLRQLSSLLKQEPSLSVTWLVRKTSTPYAVIANDPLPERAELVAFGNALFDGAEPRIRVVRGSSIDEITGAGAGVDLGVASVHDGIWSTSEPIKNVSKLIVNHGYRPDLDIFRELQVHQCYASEGPMKLAAFLLSSTGGGGDCMVQVSGGAKVLCSPEPDFYVLGAKSYGRGTTFLLKVGREQIQDVLTLMEPTIPSST